MKRENGVLIFLLVIVLAVGLAMAPGMKQVWAQPEDEEEEELQPKGGEERPNPMDDGEHGLVTFGDGTRGQLVGGRLLLLTGDRKMLAPDGSYRLSDGRTLTVSGGLASMPVDPYDRGGATQSGRPELPAVQSGRPELPLQTGRPELPAVQSGRPEIPTQAGRPEMPIDPLDDLSPGKVRTVGDDAQSGRPEMPVDPYGSSPGKVRSVGGVQSGGPEVPAVQSGRPAMPMQAGRPASPSWDPGDKVTLKDGRGAVMQQGAGGKMQIFLLQGSSKVLAPDGQYQLQNGTKVTVQRGAIQGQAPAGSFFDKAR